LGRRLPPFRNFSQDLAVCRPYMTEGDEKMILSRYASVTSRGDFVNIIDQLRSIAAANKRALPEFEPW
jgi:hypothetical protein